MPISISLNSHDALAVSWRNWFNCAYGILLLLSFLPMSLRNVRSGPRTIVSQPASNLYDRRYIPCLSPSFQTTVAAGYSCCRCSYRCRCSRRVVILVQLSANLLVICTTGGIFLACLHLFKQLRRRGVIGSTVPARYSCCCCCSYRCRCARRVVFLVQLSATCLTIYMTGGTFLACFHLFERPRRSGRVLAHLCDIPAVLVSARACARDRGRFSRCDLHSILLAKAIVPIIPDLASTEDSVQEGLSATGCDRASLKGKWQWWYRVGKCC